MMRGVPASGKSTHAMSLVKNGGDYVRVNRDLIREMLHFGVYSGKNEGVVVKTEKLIAGAALDRGQNVVVDDCNINPANEDMWRDFADQHVAKFEVVEMDTDLEECIQRNRGRDKEVPEHVIHEMALQKRDHPRYKGSVVICDIDGTIADVEHRLHYVKQDPKEWHNFFREMSNDTLREDVDKKLVEHAGAGRTIIFVSARPSYWRVVTEEWLKSNVSVPVGLVLMRPDGDKRPDTDVKKAIYDKYLKDLDIHCVIDDRPSVIRMWRDLGLTVDDVGSGKEF